MHLRARSCIAASCLFALASPAVAQEPPIALFVDPDVPVDVDALRTGLASDLNRDVGLAREYASRLHVSMRDGRAELRYSDANGVRERTVDLPGDVAEATATLVLIGGNLVRDPTVELVATPEPAPPVATQPEPAEPVPSFAVSSPFRLGINILLGAGSTPRGVEGYWYLGTDLMMALHPNVSLGITRLSLGLGVSSIEGFIFSFQATPTLELSAFVDRHVQVFAQIGVALQGRPQTAVREGMFQVAVFIGDGARFWLTDWFTISIDIGLHLVATDAFFMGSTPLPQWSVAGSLGLSTGFHF